MYTRRKFIQTLGIGAAASIAFNPVFALESPGNRKLKNIGFISGILKNDLRVNDWKPVLSETVKYGYTEIELGDGKYMGESATSFLKYCDEIGIKPVAGGAKFSRNMDEVNLSLDKLCEMDIKQAVIYWPWFSEGPFMLEDCKISSEILNQIGEVCKKRGITLNWHNHDKEFTPMEEGLPFDYIMKHTDKDMVKCEMDVYWVQKGGANPVRMLKNYRGRYNILHLKDMAPGADQQFECVGAGIIDFPSILSEAADQGINHYFVERDRVVKGLECLKTSAEYLKNVSFK